MEYRQKRALLRSGGQFPESLEPPTKRQRREAARPSPIVSAPPTPPSVPPQSPNVKTFPSESGDDSELTDCGRPLTDSNPPTLETLNSGVANQNLLETDAPNQAGWDGAGAFEGRTLSTLPSFPSIDLSHWGIEPPVNPDQPVAAPGESEQLTTELAGFANHGSQEPHNTGPVAGAHSHQPISELFNSLPNPSRGVSNDVRAPSRGERRHSAARVERTGSQERKVTTELPGCTYLFEKALTISDTNPLGRIVMPKVSISSPFLGRL